jgi:hypothetical protein
MAQSTFRVFVTSDIGDAALDRLRRKGYSLEVYPDPESAPKKIIIDKARLALTV